MSSALVFANKKSKSVEDRTIIKFPFSLGDTWSYKFRRESPTGEHCQTLEYSFKATVAKSMHKMTIAGVELDVVSIHHEGLWNCGGNDGRQLYDYEYSPLLGMYVSEILKTFRSTDGSGQGFGANFLSNEAEKKLIHFIISNPVKPKVPVTGTYLTAEELKKLYSGALVTTHTTKAKNAAIYHFKSDGTYVWEIVRTGEIKRFPRRKWWVEAPNKICIQYRKSAHCHRHKSTAIGYDRYSASRDKKLPKLWVISK